MQRTKILIFIAAFVASAALGYLLFKGGSSLSLGGAVEVDWRLLGELDYITGKAPSELQALDGQLVRIPGFMVPLEDNMRSVAEFLLVPSPQACIHVPPPPPNQMVLIDMPAGKEVEVQWGPIWIYGKLQLKSKRHLYGETSFTMIGERVESYK
ncbi:MAG: DUF3299 domain-containing protein [Proteobacteria bacterium]|jgi:hypothetical protein|nr:DUF3299 domain-containing protein [Pseudomonadota bacterium]